MAPVQGKTKAKTAKSPKPGANKRTRPKAEVKEALEKTLHLKKASLKRREKKMSPQEIKNAKMAIQELSDQIDAMEIDVEEGNSSVTPGEEGKVEGSDGNPATEESSNKPATPESGDTAAADVAIQSVETEHNDNKGLFVMDSSSGRQSSSSPTPTQSSRSSLTPAPTNSSRSSLSPASSRDSENPGDRLAAEVFHKFEVVSLNDKEDGFEGCIKGSGGFVYQIGRKGPPENAKYNLISTRSRNFEKDAKNLDGNTYGTAKDEHGRNLVETGQMRSFAGVVCRNGIEGLLPNKWKRDRLDRPIRPCHRIKVNWEIGDEIVTCWEKRATVKKYWVNAYYPDLTDPSDDPVMKVPWDVVIHDKVVLEEGADIEKLDWAILREGLRGDKNYTLWAEDRQRERSATPLFGGIA